MLKISLDSSDFDRSIGNLLSNIQNRRPMMDGIAAELLSMAEDNFETESWGGDKWKSSQRAQTETNGKTLQLSGQLAGSLSTHSSNHFARIGSNKPYAAIHHLGGQAGRNRSVSIPARPYLPINGSGNLQADGKKRLLDVVKTALANRI